MILSPLLIPIVIGLRLTGEGYVFYLQERVGYRNRLFPIYKFATMLKDSPNMAGGIITMQRDPRITPMGGFLRKTKINELPQLLNVLRGEMSFVGPRPLLVEYLPLYSDEQARRHEVRPGITGWSQVNGRNAVDWDTRLAMDVWYVDNRALLLDAKILFMTVGAVLNRKGISQQGHATMERFRGSRR